MRGPVTLIKDTWMLFSANAGLFMGIYAVPVALGLTFGIFFGLATASDIVSSMWMVVVPLVVLIVLALIVVNIIAGAGLIKAISSPADATVGSAYKFGFQNLWSYLWLSVLTGVVICLGFILLIIPGIIFMIWYSFAYFALLLEGKKGTEAMRASKEYAKGHFWQILGRFVILILINMAVAVAVRMTLGFALSLSTETLDSITNIVGVVLTPFSLVYLYLIYVDVKNAAATVPLSSTVASSVQ